MRKSFQGTSTFVPSPRARAVTAVLKSHGDISPRPMFQFGDISTEDRSHPWAWYSGMPWKANLSMFCISESQTVVVGEDTFRRVERLVAVLSRSSSAASKGLLTPDGPGPASAGGAEKQMSGHGDIGAPAKIAAKTLGVPGIGVGGTVSGTHPGCHSTPLLAAKARRYSSPHNGVPGNNSPGLATPGVRGGEQASPDDARAPGVPT